MFYEIFCTLKLFTLSHRHLLLIGRVEGEVADGGHGGAPHPRVTVVVVVEQLLQLHEASSLPQIVL